MKTRNLLITLSVAALATMNVMAADALLSPRASEHQIKATAGFNNDPSLTTGLTAVTPHVHDTAIKTVSGKDTTETPSLTCTRRMAGTPKMISACADHPGQPMPCCSVDAHK